MGVVDICGGGHVLVLLHLRVSLLFFSVQQVLLIQNDIWLVGVVFEGLVNFNLLGSIFLMIVPLIANFRLLLRVRRQLGGEFLISLLILIRFVLLGRFRLALDRVVREHRGVLRSDLWV